MHTMTEYQPRQAAAVVHSALKTALQTMENAKQNALLWFAEVQQRKLYKDLGYSTMLLYAQEELGMSQSRSYEFLNVCERLEKLPKIKEKVRSGELGITNTIDIVKVANRENERAWLDEGLKNSNRQLKDRIKKAKAKAKEKKAGQVGLDFTRGQTEPPQRKPLPQAVVPVTERVEFSPTQYARYEKLWEKIRQRGGLSSGKAEALLELMGSWLEGVTVESADSKSRRLENASMDNAPLENTLLENDIRPPVQIHIHQCPDCDLATVQTSKGEKAISGAELEQAQCDCQISEPGKRNTSAIAPKTRRQVLARDRHRCQRPGCHHTRHLELHHKVPRSKGGGNGMENLITLCSACHRLVHENPRAAQQLLVKEIQADYLFAEKSCIHFPFMPYSGFSDRAHSPGGGVPDDHGKFVLTEGPSTYLPSL